MTSEIETQLVELPKSLMDEIEVFRREVEHMHGSEYLLDNSEYLSPQAIIIDAVRKYIVGAYEGLHDPE